jgi:hypothetical protein
VRPFAFAIAACLMLGTVGACKKDQSTTGDSAQESMGLYAKGFNALIDTPMEMVKEYSEAIPEAGPAADSKPRLFPRQNFATSKITEAKAAFAAAKKAAPKSLAAIGPISDKAITAIEKVIKTYTEAEKYYSAEDYKDDKFAKGNELHTKMTAESKEFRQAISEMQASLSSVEDIQAADELKKYGPTDYGYWFRYFNQQAKKFVDAVQAAETPEALAKLEESFKPIDEAFAGAQKFLESKSSPQATFKAYVDSTSRYHSSAKKLLRLVKDGKAADSQEITQESSSLVSSYNSLISMANSLYELEGNNLLK